MINAAFAVITPWIYEHSQWPDFFRDDNALIVALADCRFRQGKAIGKMMALGCECQRDASLTTLTNDIITSSAIKGEQLNSSEIRSSVARRLGMDMAGAITRQTLVLNHMLDGFKGQMNMSKYAKIAKCSNDTALRDIQALVDAGILRKNASGGRSTSYRLPDIPQRTDPVYFAANR